MKERIISFNDIKRILGSKCTRGWNDKRSYGRRLKIDHLLADSDARLLQRELTEQFPQFIVTVCTDNWSSVACNDTFPVTVIHVRDKVDPYADLKAARRAGHTIQILSGGDWYDLYTADWDAPVEDYRVKPVDVSPETPETISVMKITKSTTTTLEVEASDLIETFSHACLDIAKDLTDDVSTLLGHLKMMQNNLQLMSGGHFKTIFCEGYTMMTLPPEAFDFVEDFYSNQKSGETLEIKVVGLDGDVVDTISEEDISY